MMNNIKRKLTKSPFCGTSCHSFARYQGMSYAVINDVLTYYTVPIKGMLIDINNTVALNVHSIKPYINSASVELLYSNVHVASSCYSYQLLWENHTHGD